MFDLLKAYEKEKAAKENYKYLLEEFTPHEIADALVHFCCAKEKGMRIEDIIYEPDEKTGRQNKVLMSLYNAANVYSRSFNENVWEVFTDYLYQVQMSVQINKWKKTKQVFMFDKDFTDELINTDADGTFRSEIMEKLPCSSLYMDFSDNRELCEEIRADGMLIDVTPVLMGDDKRFCVSSLLYYNGKAMTNTIELSAANKEEITVNKMVDDFKRIFEKIAPDLSSKDYERLRKIMTLRVTVLLYLSTENPDLREKSTSVINRQQAKRKKLPKSDMPPVEYMVGERFGAAFRKWTMDASGQEKNDPTGKHVRPHLRRAHFQRYLVGPKDSTERKYVWRWKHPCLVGLEEKDAAKKLDVVKHNLDRDDDKKKNFSAKKKNGSDGYPF